MPPRSMLWESSRWNTAGRVQLHVWHIGVSFLVLHVCIFLVLLSYVFVERADQMEASLMFIGSSLNIQDGHTGGTAVMARQERVETFKIQMHVYGAMHPDSCLLLLKTLSEVTPYNLSIPLHIHIDDSQFQLLYRPLDDFTWSHGSKQIHLQTKSGTVDRHMMDFLYTFSGNDSHLFLFATSLHALDLYRHVITCMCLPNPNRYKDTKQAGVVISTCNLDNFEFSTDEDQKQHSLWTHDRFLCATQGQLLPFQDALYFPHFLKAVKSLTFSKVSMDDEVFEQSRIDSQTWNALPTWEKVILLLMSTENFYFIHVRVAPRIHGTKNNSLKTHPLYWNDVQLFFKHSNYLPAMANASVNEQEPFLGRGFQNIPPKSTGGISWQRWELTAEYLNGLKQEKFNLPRLKCSSRIRTKPCLGFTPRTPGRAISDKYTIILSHFWKVERRLLLAPMLEHYAGAQSVEKIFVVWHNMNVPCPGASIIGSVPVIFVPQECDSLNNRYLVDNRVTTECIFMLDDDIQVHTEDVERLFLVWQKFPSKLVGYFPRWFRPEKEYSGKYLPTNNRKSYRVRGYSFILTKAMMFSGVYLHEYLCGKGRALHEIVDEAMNAEDLGLNLMVFSILNQLPALAVMPLWPILDYGVQKAGMGGLFARGRQHYSSRDRSLGLFMKLFNIRSSLLCCQQEIVDVDAVYEEDPFTMKSITELGRYVHYPCMNALDPNWCTFLQSPDVEMLHKTNITLS